jgi:archaellum component FlaF (FlaF/FlaG flagellin family)
MKYTLLYLIFLLFYSCTNNSTAIKPKENKGNQTLLEKSDTSILIISETNYSDNDNFDFTLIHRSNNVIYLLKNDVLVDSVSIHNKHVVPRKNETDMFSEYIMLNSDGHFFHDNGTKINLESIGESRFLYEITDLSWCANYFLIDFNSDNKLKNVFFEKVHKDCLRIVNYKGLKVGVSYFGSYWNDSIDDAEQLYGVFNLTTIKDDTVRILFNKKYLSSKYPDFSKSACLLNEEELQIILKE